MQIKRIQCPQCEVVLDVKNEEEVPEKRVFCPRCSTELLVKFKPKGDPVEAHTYYAKARKPAADSGETQLGGANYSTTAGGGSGRNGSADGYTYVRLMADGVSYPLKEGRNVVGRRATKSCATVQITTSDLTMSRQHIIINVTTLADGTKKVVLSNYQNKNPTLINGMQIDDGDAVRLSDGNTITIGRTTLRVMIQIS